MEEQCGTIEDVGYKKGLKDGLPVCLGYIPIAFAFGIMASKSGLVLWLSQLMGSLIYSASGQFAILNQLQGGETLIFMYALTIFVINCRYVLLSLSLSQRLDSSMGTLKRMLFGFFNTDEIFAIAVQQKGKLKAPYLFGIATLPYIGWFFGTIAGYLFTDLLPESISTATGIIVYAMYLAIIIPPARKSKPIAFVILLAVIMSVLLECNPLINSVLTPGLVIIICAVSTALIATIFFPMNIDNEEEKG